jgi:23S rRNA pseudouridine2457 synthase
MKTPHTHRVAPLRYIILNKPYGIVSQFTREGPHEGLASVGRFPADVYAAGRLDADSEGLLLLTNDGRVIHRLTDPKFAHPRTYLAEIEGVPGKEDLARLEAGPTVKGRPSRQVEVKLLDGEPDLPSRPVPIRFRKSVPTCWIQITLFEGRNRQVRRMTAAVGHPTLRLIRNAIGPLSLGALAPGHYRDLTEQELETLFESLSMPRVAPRPAPAKARGEKKPRQRSAGA